VISDFERPAAVALGLPPGTKACLFDLDGVLTQTAKVHAAAWKEMFDAYLRGRVARSGDAFVAFDPVADYDAYVDGKARAAGTRSFLAARGIDLPEGAPDNPPGTETVQGLGNRKNEIVLRRIRSDGVAVYEGSVRYVRAVREAGVSAGRAGGFGCVVGVDPADQAAELEAHGADVVVADLAELLGSP